MITGGSAVGDGKTRVSRSHTISSFLRSSSIRKKFGYDKLPPQIINVNVKKLDGSSFELEITKNARVAELKKAVERFFCDLPDDSWSYVWGQFCLCYRGQKLLHDGVYIRLYGIKDGDQLCFVRRDANVTCKDEDMLQSTDYDVLKQPIFT